MDDNLENAKFLKGRVQQLEHERDNLRKDIEQLCMQQAGPSYVVVATRMHFQRTASLEQEIENLKKKLAGCSRDNLNLQEELSEAYRIKGQLAVLHSDEVSKNLELENQIKFFQGSVAAVFAERDQSLLEAEKAKDKEESMLHNLIHLQKRVEELAGDLLEENKLTAKLQYNLTELEEQNKIFKMVVEKFYQFSKHFSRGYDDYEDISWDGKCACLLRDLDEKWSGNDHWGLSTSKYISDLEEQLETLRKSVKSYQYKLQGLDIENHLKKRVSELEKKLSYFGEKIKNGISALLHSHSQDRIHIAKLLDEGKSQIKSIADMVEERVEQLNMSRLQYLKSSQIGMKIDGNEYRDVYVTPDAETNFSPEWNGPDTNTTTPLELSNPTEDLALALREKVSTLLLLSQQEERHLLERNVNIALQQKVEELQRNLLQVTNEKVKVLMELAQLKQGYQLLQEKIGNGVKQENIVADSAEKRDGKLKSLLKKTYLRRWVGTENLEWPSSSMDLARMKIEIVALKETMECMEHLTSSIQRLRLSLLKVKETIGSKGTTANSTCVASLNTIITEAEQVKTALGSSPPENPYTASGDALPEAFPKIDSVSSAGLEMVELLLLAAQILKDGWDEC